MRQNLDQIKFNPANIAWQAFGTHTGFSYHLLNVDVETRVIDLLFNFEANQKCFYHRHHQPSSALVLHGEQHIWEPLTMVANATKFDRQVTSRSPKAWKRISKVPDPMAVSFTKIFARATTWSTAY